MSERGNQVRGNGEEAREHRVTQVVWRGAYRVGWNGEAKEAASTGRAMTVWPLWATLFLGGKESG